MTADTPNISTILAGENFAHTLARHILKKHGDTPQDLGRVQIYLPTRRACRILQDALIKNSKHAALIMPRMNAIGDIDDDELMLRFSELDISSPEVATPKGALARVLTDLPPAISRLRRQAMLARLVQAVPDFKQDFAQALQLSGALGRLMDQVYTEGLEWDNLETLVPAEFSEHWQITLDFLSIVTQEWPKILQELGAIDYANRRNILIEALAESLDTTPPATPIIAAGTTGSIPAVARVLRAVSNAPHGHVILPGYDPELPSIDWDALEETHPQYGFKQLLERMNATRNNIKTLSEESTSPQTEDVRHTTSARRALSRTIMCPASNTDAWPELTRSMIEKEYLPHCFNTLKMVECTDIHEEASVIALLLRETIETPNKTAALITSDRTLARHVSAICQKWDIQLDDSAGRALQSTSSAIFAKLIVKTCTEHLSPTSVLALLKHPLFSRLNRSQIEDIDRALRGPKPARGWQGITQSLKNAEHIAEIEPLTLPLLESLTALYELNNAHTHSYQKIIATHLQALNALLDPQHAKENEDIQHLLTFLSELENIAEDLPAITLEEYGSSLELFMSTISLRSPHGAHPRLRILGQLEARLIDTDLVILSGLNEGTWPSDSKHDPWMSRQMRTAFGLPSHERSIGLAAHDFVQGLCARSVVITRAARNDGAPTVPSRWIERMDAVIQAANLDTTIYRDHRYAHWASTMHHADHFLPATRPAPKPPANKRPNAISITQIGIWLKDPYAIYARHILRLKPLDPLEKQADAALRGDLIHRALEKFVKDYPADIPTDAHEILKKNTANILEETTGDTSGWAYWTARLDQTFSSYLAHEHEWRKMAKPFKLEVKGSYNVHVSSEDIQTNMTVIGRADRIDRMEGGYGIIDYKSGGSFSVKGIANGDYPQLGMEAVILSHGGFSGTQRAPVQETSYWIINGSGKTLKTYTLSQNGKNDPQQIDTLISQTKEGLTRLCTHFSQENTPYYAVPNPNREPRFNDYEHLERTQEWLESEA